MSDARATTAGEPEPPVMSDRERRRARQVAWAVRLGLVVIKLLARTWRIRPVNARSYQELRARGQPFALCFWHGQMLPLLWLHRDQRIAVLISIHKDGEIIARIAEALGCRTVRGSSSKGGSRALLGLVRELQDGHEIAVTPDGPRGPARKFAPGALVAAQRANAPIVMMGVHCPRAWRLNTWDGFMIPKPFARVTVAYSEPVLVGGASPREAAAEAERFERLLDTLNAEAARA